MIAAAVCYFVFVYFVFSGKSNDVDESIVGRYLPEWYSVTEKNFCYVGARY